MRLLGVLLICASLCACGATDRRADEPPPRHATTPPTTTDPPTARGSESAPASTAEALNGFGLDVWSQLRASGHDENFAISPASIAGALTMAYGGARGPTAREMAEAMHLGASPEVTLTDAGALVRSWNEPRDAYRLAVANRIYAERTYELRQSYLDTTRAQLGADVEQLDFRGAAEASRQTINAWVLERTQQRIADLLPPGSVDDETRAVLVNAVYFRGLWANAFDRARTTDEGFAVNGAEEMVNVPMMHGTGGRFARKEDAMIAELPYRGDDLAMMVVLPQGAGGLAALEAELGADDVASWAGELRAVDNLEVSLPRFRIATDSISLRETLEALGMRAAFSDAADFGAMTEEGQAPLKLSGVHHRVFVEVNEEGTEAAAATGVTMRAVSAPPEFRADRPFLFFIRDVRSGAILFAGRVVDPRAT